MSDTLSKFTIIQGSPPALPGCCASCGTTQGPFIDWGLQLEFHGAVYLCVEELLQIANQLDYHSPSQWKALMAEKNDIRNDYNKVADENERLRSALGLLNGIDLGDRSSVINDLQANTEPEQVTTESNVTEQESNGQDAESGSSNVQRDVELDELIGLGDTI